MALSVTSAPWQQINMPALDLRRYLAAAFLEGVVGLNDMAVAQRAAGANMSVDISSGQALIQGDAITNQGLYYAYNDAIFNLTGFAAANATNPRIDRVTLRIRDQFHGDAANDISFQIVTGTATAGATLVNLTGAAAVPTSQLLLANVLVPALATTITTANIDTTVRPYATAFPSGYGYQTYAVQWNNAGTANTLGNGTLTGRYMQIGKTIHARISLTWGTTTVAGNSWWQFTLPVAGAVADNSELANAIDTSANSRYALMARMEATNLMALYTLASPVVLVSAGTVPFTWATTDALTIKMTYEAL